MNQKCHATVYILNERRRSRASANASSLVKEKVEASLETVGLFCLLRWGIFYHTGTEYDFFLTQVLVSIKVA